MRLGVTAKTVISEAAKLRRSAEAVAASTETDASEATTLLTNLTTPFAASRSNNSWGRLGAELDYRLSASSVVSASVHSASKGNDASYSGSVSLKMSF